MNGEWNILGLRFIGLLVFPCHFGRIRGLLRGILVPPPPSGTS